MTQFVTMDRTESCFLLSFNTTSRLSCTPYEWVMVLLWPPGGIFLGIYPWWVISLTCRSLCEWLLGSRRPSVDCGFSSTFSLPGSRGVTKTGDQYGVSPGCKYTLGGLVSKEACLYDIIFIFRRLHLHSLKILPGAPRARHSNVWVNLLALEH